MRFSICSWTFGNPPLEEVFALVSFAGYPCIDLTANIEETDLHQAFLTLHDWVEVVHFADSNRQALGQGHIDFSKVAVLGSSAGVDWLRTRS
jgi:hypothetical protein